MQTAAAAQTLAAGSAANSKPKCAPAAGSAAPAKRKRAPPKPKPPAAAPAGVSAKAWEALQTEFVAKLRSHAEYAHKLVDADWHDGWEDQGQEVDAYLRHSLRIVEAVHEIARVPGLPLGVYELANNAIFTLADSWRAIDKIEFRMDVDELAGMLVRGEYRFAWKEGDASFEARFSTGGDAASWAWRVLLRAMCGEGARVPDAQILRYMRDVSDLGNPLTYLADDDDHADDDLPEGQTPPAVPGGEAGRERVRRLAESKGHEQFKTRVKKLKKRRYIDRRYDGTPERRTRRYSSDEGYYS